MMYWGGGHGFGHAFNVINYQRHCTQYEMLHYTLQQAQNTVST